MRRGSGDQQGPAAEVGPDGPRGEVHRGLAVRHGEAVKLLVDRGAVPLLDRLPGLPPGPAQAAQVVLAAEEQLAFVVDDGEALTGVLASLLASEAGVAVGVVRTGHVLASLSLGYLICLSNYSHPRYVDLDGL